MKGSGLKSDHIEVICSSFKGVLSPSQKLKVWLFGSRARGSYKKYSDIDLLIDSDPQLIEAQLIKIKEALEESQLPFKVDLVKIEDLNVSYGSQVNAEKRLFFEC